MLKAQFVHANAPDKMAKVHEQLNTFLARLKKEDIVSVNTTEISYSGIQPFYSYTVLLVYESSE